MFRIVRAGSGFRMVLNRNDRERLVAHTFDTLIVKIDVRHLNFGWKRIGQHRKPVIMGSDLDMAVAKVFHRLIATAMSECQLKSLATKSASEQLMAKTNAKSGRAGLRDLLYFLDFFVHGSWIARAV